jgi:putative SOS response-associated peptidase YedK
MCGRFSFGLKKQDVAKKLPNVNLPAVLMSNYNIAPTQNAYVITAAQPNQLQLMRWGLIPHWTKDSTKTGNTINAKSEEAHLKAAFKIPLQQKRCWVISDGFYEWKTYGKNRLPYRIVLKDSPLMIQAGLWDEWFDGEKTVQSFTILTTEPNLEMANIHNRMPLILTTEKEQQTWFSNDYQSLLKVPDDHILSMYRISEKLNSVHYNQPDLHLEQQEILTLF